MKSKIQTIINLLQKKHALNPYNTYVVISLQSLQLKLFTMNDPETVHYFRVIFPNGFFPYSNVLINTDYTNIKYINYLEGIFELPFEEILNQIIIRLW